MQVAAVGDLKRLFLFENLPWLRHVTRPASSSTIVDNYSTIVEDMSSAGHIAGAVQPVRMSNFLHAAARAMKKNRVGKSAQERILDAAEQLFARRGFYGVSVRNITQAAGVDVALVNYHFGAKRALFTAVFERRAELLNVERLALLEEVRRAYMPSPPPVEAIVSAFTRPLLDRSARGGAGWKSYFALVAQVNNSPE